VPRSFLPLVPQPQFGLPFVAAPATPARPCYSGRQARSRPAARAGSRERARRSISSAAARPASPSWTPREGSSWRWWSAFGPESRPWRVDLALVVDNGSWRVGPRAADLHRRRVRPRSGGGVRATLSAAPGPL